MPHVKSTLHTFLIHHFACIKFHFPLKNFHFPDKTFYFPTNISFPLHKTLSHFLSISHIYSLSLSLSLSLTHTHTHTHRDLDIHIHTHTHNSADADEERPAQRRRAQRRQGRFTRFSVVESVCSWDRRWRSPEQQRCRQAGYDMEIPRRYSHRTNSTGGKIHKCLCSFMLGQGYATVIIKGFLFMVKRLRWKQPDGVNTCDWYLERLPVRCLWKCLLSWHFFSWLMLLLLVDWCHVVVICCGIVLTVWGRGF